MRVDAKAAEALIRLARTVDGAVLQSLVTAELETTKGLLVGAPVEHVPRLQGRAQILDELAKLLRG